jgi:RNA polymerase II subunit A C-terminal domain phosphatase
MSTELYLPSSLPFPIKILKVSLKPPAEISRGTNLLHYSYVHHTKPTANEPEPEPELRYGTWDSPIEGMIDKWNISLGDTVSAKKAREKPALLVNEPCKHGMQLGGLCCLCGKDMTEYVSPPSTFSLSIFSVHMRHHFTPNPRLNASTLRSLC